MIVYLEKSISQERIEVQFFVRSPDQSSEFLKNDIEDYSLELFDTKTKQTVTQIGFGRSTPLAYDYPEQQQNLIFNLINLKTK